jgi:pyrroline-5-carboxylate reductase
MNLKCGVIGCGKMASVIVQGMAKSKQLDFVGYNPTLSKAQALMAQVGGTVVSRIEDLPECDYYLIGAKPQHFKHLQGAFKPAKSSIILALMAGITVSSLSLGFKTQQVVRIMPNTPCLVGEGVIALSGHPGVAQEVFSFLKKTLSPLGLVEIVESEELMDLFTIFTGSAPAFVFEFVRVLAMEFERRGVSQGGSQKLITQMVYGAAKLLKQSKESPEVLQDNVTSKGGVTEAALEVLKFEDLISQTVDQALVRIQELKQDL